MTTVIEPHAAIGAARDAAPPWRIVSPWRRWWPAFAVLGLTVFAVAIRWWALSHYDGEMWGDEATLMNEARRFLTGQYRGPFINDALGNPALFSFLAGVVIVIGLVNVQREIAYKTSVQYQAFMSNAALAWGRYLGSVGTTAASVVSPLGYPGEFPRLFAPRATLCNAEWAGQWQRCPAARVVIFDAGADADAARYAAVTHHAVHVGPVRFGRRLFWYAIASGAASLPDPATVLGHASAS